MEILGAERQILKIFWGFFEERFGGLGELV